MCKFQISSLQSQKKEKNTNLIEKGQNEKRIYHKIKQR